MNKDLPPPYSETYAPPPAGFNIPSNQISTQPVYPLSPHPSGPPVVLSSAALPPFAFGPHPQPTTCYSCHQQTTTKIISEPSIKTHLMAIVLCLFGMEKEDGLYPSVPNVPYHGSSNVPTELNPSGQQPQIAMSAPPTVFGPNSLTLTCPYCHKGITSVVRAESSSKTHLIAVLLCFVS
ncbi:hypothetical protein FQR65_LT10444 [Abscondita terminalis]|nr:hypothetical protein FQR65_LT10444 [Abscondita terminalis]